MRGLPTVVLLLVIVLARAEGPLSRCFARFNLVSGQCEEELGTVDEDDCCQNPHYGFIDAAGECQFCGSPVWTDWTPWSKCWNMCGSGVVQRTRKCHGLSECSGVQASHEMKPCESDACCPVAKWEVWGEWSPCSVSCGSVRGPRERQRVCSHPTPGCELTCEGLGSETEACAESQPCPVHGGWAHWSRWTPCTDECIRGPFSEDRLGVYPTRTRFRVCSSPAPSQSTTPVGNDCHGNDEDIQNCSELPNCPVDGGWGAWGPPGACSASCGQGLKLLIRQCDNPPPEYGGQYCVGTSTKTEICMKPCPVHGVWTGWAEWADCTASCHSNRDSTRSRLRSCSNPAPSSDGNKCLGEGTDRLKCDELPNCPVDGAWGPWGAYGGCTVTCGVGQRISLRACDSPAPKHLGEQCLGSSSRALTCTTNTHCPIDGVWSDWLDWSDCMDRSHSVRCSMRQGSQSRSGSCLGRDFGGKGCPPPAGGGGMFQMRGCYDIHNCNSMPGLGWSEWSEWGVCTRSLDNKMKSLRVRVCEPDLSEYSPFNHRGLEMSFSGTPKPRCQRSPTAVRELVECVRPPVDHLE
ncbi:unnamed protein product [Arctogadus glacialis]